MAQGIAETPEAEEARKAKISVSLQGRQFTEEHRKNLSLATSLAQIGKPLSREHKASISQGLTGRHFTEEHKANISQARSGEKNPLFGKHLPLETRRRISCPLST